MRFILNDMIITYNRYLGNTSFKFLFRMTLNSFFGVVRMNVIFVISGIRCQHEDWKEILTTFLKHSSTILLWEGNFVKNYSLGFQKLNGDSFGQLTCPIYCRAECLYHIIRKQIKIRDLYSAETFVNTICQKH